MSKAHKVGERLDDAKRNDYIAKDALDMLRLLRGADDSALAGVLRNARGGSLKSGDAHLDAAVVATVDSGLQFLRKDFARERARGCVLAGRAAAGRDDPAVVAASLAALVSRLLDSL